MEVVLDVLEACKAVSVAVEKPVVLVNKPYGLAEMVRSVVDMLKKSVEVLLLWSTAKMLPPA